MLALGHKGSLAIAALFVMALTIDAADARRGGGGGGGMHRGGGGGMRVGTGGGGRFAGAGVGRPTHPIAGRPGVGRPGVGVGRPGVGVGRAGYGGGWGAAAALGAGAAYAAGSYYGNGYYDQGYSDPGVTYAQGDGDLIAECARRFKTYDPATQTYIRSAGVRASCP